MGKKYKAGAIIAVVGGVFSFLLLIWTVLVWIMIYTRNLNVLVEGYSIALAAIFRESLISINDVTGHLLFAGLTLFFLIGTWVNMHSAYQLSASGKRSTGVSVFLVVMHCIAVTAWVFALFMCSYSLNEVGKFAQQIAIAIICVIMVILCALFEGGFTAKILLMQIKEGPSPIYASQSYNQPIMPSPLPFNQPMAPAAGQGPMVAPPVNPQPLKVQPLNQQPVTPQFLDTSPVVPQYHEVQFYDPNPQLDMGKTVPRQDVIQQSAASQMGSVRVFEGQVKGTRGYRLPDGYKIVVGKNSYNASLVLSNPHISDVHCSIRYNEQSDTYIVRDHSLNGTFSGGQRLPKKEPVQFRSGAVLSLANGAAKIILGE